MLTEPTVEKLRALKLNAMADTWLEHQKDAKIDGVNHYVIRVAQPKGASTDLYINKKTLLLRRMRYTDQGVPTEENYKLYKKIKGVMVARWRQTKNVQGELVAKVKKVTINGKLAKGVFAKPSAK